MTKTIYFAPTAEQIDLKIEKNFMSNDNFSEPSVDQAEIVTGEW